MNDICTLTLDSRIKAFFRYLPVRVTKVTEGLNKEKGYTICSLYGHLTGSYDRKELDYRGVIQLLYMELIQQKMGSRKVCHCRWHALCMVTRNIATARETVAYCHGVHVRLQTDYVPLYVMEVGEIKNCVSDGFDEASSSDGDDGNEDDANSA